MANEFGWAFAWGQQSRHDFSVRLDDWSQWCINTTHYTMYDTIQCLNLPWPIPIKQICVPCEIGNFSMLAQTRTEIDHCQQCPPSYSAAALSTAFANQIPTLDCNYKTIMAQREIGRFEISTTPCLRVPRSVVNTLLLTRAGPTLEARAKFAKTSMRRL